MRHYTSVTNAARPKMHPNSLGGIMCTSERADADKPYLEETLKSAARCSLPHELSVMELADKTLNNSCKSGEQFRVKDGIVKTRKEK